MLNPKCLTVLFALIAISSLNPRSASLADDTVIGTTPNAQTNAVSKRNHIKAAAQGLSTLATGSWFLKPVTKLQEQLVRLDQRLAKMNIPLDQLAPATLALNKDL